MYVLVTQSRCNFSLFFLHYSGARRDLLSFPTRRSSDLVEDGDRTLPAGPRLVMVAERVAGQTERPQELGLLAAIDRKSTRVNSSHSQISYAVFCLKKKNSYTTAGHWSLIIQNAHCKSIG